MKIIAYEGPAGTGKTTRLIQSLESLLTTDPLRDGQRVLALTFMHGSRRRLHERLSGLPNLRGRFDCTTFDSFALMVCHRCKSLLARMKLPLPGEGEFDKTSDCCGALLEKASIQSWIAAGFPAVVVDEAQDLSNERLRIVIGLAAKCSLLIAADEFQCLDDSLKPNPAVEWLQTVAIPEKLSCIYRTKQPDLLQAALAIRSGADVPANESGFKVFATPNAKFAATFLANAIAWHKFDATSIITPSRKGRFAETVVGLVTQHQLGKQKVGPFSCPWERTDDDEANAAMGTLALPDTMSHPGLLSCIGSLQGTFPSAALGEWADKQCHVAGRVSFGKEDVERQITRLFSLRRHYSHSAKCRRVAMTVHQAKNREFDGAIVIWPYTVAGDPDQKRRLLYNAVTRARKWCLVLTQSQEMLDAPPFKAHSPSDLKV